MALASLTPRLIAITALGIAFVAVTIAVSAGSFGGLDQQVAEAMHSIWRGDLHPLFQGIAELGGIELTSVLMLGLLIYLVRAGFGSDAWAVAVFVPAQILEVLYKMLLHHPGPLRSIAHDDGPSLSSLLTGSVAGNSFPSGHMVRTLIVFGLIAFVVRRLTTSGAVRRLSLVVAFLVVVVMAFDRIYLGVHWESDVIGGLLLGGIALLAGTVWLDRPRRARG